MTATMERGLTSFERDLNDYIVPHIERKYIIELADELEGNGIDNIETFEEALFHSTNSYRPDEEFAEFLFTELSGNEIDPIIEGCIDWQVVWDSAYRFDFWSCCIDGTTYYFHNNY